MEELHAAIVAHLRAQRRQFAETGEREATILGIWRERCTVPRCTICGAAIDDENGLYNPANRLVMRECCAHDMPF